MKRFILNSVKPPKKERLNEKIIFQIKNLILNKNFEIGQRLPSEREMAKNLKVSRSVIRETIRSLEQAGLIEVKPGAKGGAFITEKYHLPLYRSVYDLLHNKRINLYHLLEARKVIECSIVKMVIKSVKKEDIQDLESINQKMVNTYQDGEKIRKINADFHIKLAEISGNPLLKLITQAIFEIINQLLPDSTRTPHFIRYAYEKHKAIIEAIKKKDLKLCEQTISKDIDHMKRLKGFKLK